MSELAPLAAHCRSRSAALALRRRWSCNVPMNSIAATGDDSRRSPTSAGGRVVRFVIYLSAVLMVLGGLACALDDSQDNSGNTRVPDVRDPGGKWRTYLPSEFVIYPYGIPHEVNAVAIDPVPKTGVVMFGVIPQYLTTSPPRRPAFATISVLRKPEGVSIADLYMPLRKVTSESIDVSLPVIRIEEFSFFTITDSGGMTPSIHLITERDGFVIQFEIDEAALPTARALVASIVRNFEPLQ